jgi:23S rRNA (cytosine1962-C5)-methyltransferase
MENIKIWVGEVPGYKLLDSGKREKLEEIEGIKIKRNEPRAWWGWSDEASKQLASELQKEQSAKDHSVEKGINIGINGIKAKIKFKKSSKHIGIFPEQAAEWQWIREKIMNYELGVRKGEKEKLKVLNLFGYTGIASLVAASSGAKVTHVDASKQSVDWAKENQKLSGLGNVSIHGEQDQNIRWIVDDVVKFLKREIKRGVKYDAIIMDPPSYGKGPKGEVWKIEEQIGSLLQTCREILSDRPLFVILNMYSTELSSISVANLLTEMTKGLGGKVEQGELAIKEESSKRLLPMSIFAIWNNEIKD